MPSGPSHTAHLHPLVNLQILALTDDWVKANVAKKPVSPTVNEEMDVLRLRITSFIVKIPPSHYLLFFSF